jgi:hypothetical protein
MMVRTLLIALISVVAFVLEFACTKDHNNKQYVAQEHENVLLQKQELVKTIDPMLVNTDSDMWYMGGPGGSSSWNKFILFQSDGRFIFVEGWWGVDKESAVYDGSDTVFTSWYENYDTMTGSWYTIGNKITIEPDGKSMMQLDTATEPYTVDGETLSIENLYPGEYYRSKRD